jgi:hypothetical protein
MNVQLHFLFSRNHKLGSKLISWGTHSLNPRQEPTPSHIALLVNKRWVFESTLSDGVRIVSYKKWLEINEEVKCIPCYKQFTYVDIKCEFKKLKKKRYDYFGVIYFGYRLVLLKALFIPLPKQNLFNASNKYFCSEAIGKLLGEDYSMKAPTQLIPLLSLRK